jgi:lipopolysaccharide transport system ATP-binding protein
MGQLAIEAVGLSKRYYIGEDQSRHRLAHALMPWRDALAHEEFWAIRDLSFKVEQGETVGIIGQNGAGKSTLLKVLSRVTAPTEGRARLRGRVGTLLEVGTGFHPELTGRENIHLNAAILGLTPREIAKRFDEIVAFSEIEKFIDTPVKRYSSGMFVRLAFAVAIHLEPDILIVDEVLAVGDVAFQRKSVDRLDEAQAKNGRTILFVSHSLSTMRRFCRRSIVLKNGLMTFDGPLDEGINHYITTISNDLSIKEANLKDRLSRTSGEVRFTSANALDVDGVRKWSFRHGDTIKLAFDYEVMAPIPGMTFLLRLYSNLARLGERDDAVAEIREVVSHRALAAGHSGTIELTLPSVKLMPNEFALYVCLSRTDGLGSYDVIDSKNINLPALIIKDDTDDRRQGVVSLDFELKEITRKNSTEMLSHHG